MTGNRHRCDRAIGDSDSSCQAMRRQQLISARELGGVRPKKGKGRQEFLNSLLLRLVATTNQQFHRDDGWYAEDLCSCTLQPCSRGGHTTKTIDQDVGIEQQHLGGTLPSFGAQMPRELNAISDIGPVGPHSEELGFHEIAERPGSSGRWRRDDQNHLSGADGKISRQRDMKFTARWDLRIQIDSPEHGLPFSVASCHYSLSKRAYLAHGVNGAAQRKCAVTAL